MLSFDQVGLLLDDMAEEFPPEFFQELNGGVCLLPEAKPSLIVGAALSITAILGYSAMAGIVGGGGLGAIAINYGYYRTDTEIMLVMIVILVLLVHVFQGIGNLVARKCDKRIR